MLTMTGPADGAWGRLTPRPDQGGGGLAAVGPIWSGLIIGLAFVTVCLWFLICNHIAPYAREHAATHPHTEVAVPDAGGVAGANIATCLLYTSPSPRD